MNEIVSFTQMKDGTAEDYALLGRNHSKLLAATPDTLFGLLKLMEGPGLGYQIDRYQHSLQSATRAMRDGQNEAYVVMCLLHDVGDPIAPENHSQVAAAILRPYLDERLYWITAHHGVFQGYYYFHHVGQDPDAREMFRGHEHFADCAEFCAKYDQNCFDPAYDTAPLSEFEPMVRRIFEKPIEGFV